MPMKKDRGRTIWTDHGGRYHRKDGPAIVYEAGNAWGYPAGREEWYQHGQLHRIDGPAQTDNQGRHWFVNGQRHRIDGPAVEYTNGDFEWYLNGRRHRENGPAYQFNGVILWHRDGHLHREDGPAHISRDIERFFLHNKEIPKELWQEKQKATKLTKVLATLESFADQAYAQPDQHQAAGQAILEFLADNCSHSFKTPEGACVLCDHDK